MDAAEIATKLTIALIERLGVVEVKANDPQLSAKWVGKAFETILIGVCKGIDESNKPRG